MPRTILDVSRWQGRIDWDAVKRSGKIDGVMLRVLGNKNGKPYLDPYFARNYAECARRGIPVGGYYYTCAVTPRQTTEELAARVAEAAAQLEAWGLYAMVYTYTNFADTALDMATLAAYDLWIADCRGTRPTRKHGMWQYTSTGKMDGVSGPVDFSHAYKDYPNIIQRKGLGQLKGA